MTSKIVALATLWLALCATAIATPVVTVSPSSVTLASEGTQQFTAVVTGTKKDLTVSWSASAGTIDSSGMFTAPIVTSTETITVKATRVGHSKQFATVTVTVLPVPHFVALTWNPDVGAVSFSVYRGNSPDGSFALIASAITQTAYNDESVVSGETYYYVTTATNDAGEESGYSNIAAVVVP